MNKLALGTAQFGKKYGITNQIGKVEIKQAREIINLAKNKNIDLVDTAISYGDSEKMIGEIGVLDFNFVSKLPPLPKHKVNIDTWVFDQVKLSLKRLKVKSLYGLLIHKTKDLEGNFGKLLINSLYRLKLKKLVKKIGISIYDPIELDQLFDDMNIDIIQAPLNIFDQRLIHTGWLSKLSKKNIEVHARSIFLQGLLLISKKNLPPQFNRWNNLWKVWHEWLIDNNISALEASIRYGLAIKEVKKVIVGVEEKQQLKEILAASVGKIPSLPAELIINDLNLLNPSNWKQE